ncbi:MAG: hypothetical protein LPK03_08355 [Pontibacter sp.]|nr:hypothetical protein [Pontibacter sp.]
MNPAGEFKTRLPKSVYGIVPKTLLLVILLFIVSNSWILAVAAGIPAGLLLHFLLNAYDSKVTFEQGVISFYFFRPWLRKQTVNLSKIDNVILAPERKDYVLKNAWWKSDMVLPLGYSKLLRYRDQSLIYTLNFRTNREDTLKLAELLRQQFPSGSSTV